jgi:periplasmic copper chaperone A
MRLHHLLISVPLVLGAPMLGACHREPKTVGADHAWIRLAAVPGRPAAAYLTVHGGAGPARLVAIDSDLAGSSELHQSMKDGDMASMKRIDGVDVPAGATVSFRPGGYHIMLFGMSPQARPGGAAKLVLRFAKGPTVETAAKLVGAGDAAPY